MNNPHLNKADSNYVNYWCSMEILKSTQQNIGKLGLVEIAEFLATFHPSCKQNAEFSEWSNELLFTVLINYPAFTLQLISKNSSLYRNQILEELGNPVNDGISIQAVIEKLESLDDTRLFTARDIIIQNLKER